MTKIIQVILSATAALCVILFPIKGFMLIMLIAVGIDTMTGVAASIKQHGWASLISHKYFNVPIKLFFYLTCIYLFYVVDLHVFEGHLLDVPLLVTKTGTIVFLYIESKSFDENQKVFSGKSIPQWFTEIYSKLKALKRGVANLNDYDERR